MTSNPLLQHSLHLYDTSGAAIWEAPVTDSLRNTTDLRFGSVCLDRPGGYSSCSFNIAHDIRKPINLKTAYGLKIYNGSHIVWQGRINPITRSGNLQRGMSIVANGWQSVFMENKLHKFWVDNTVIPKLKWPPGREQNQVQNELLSVVENNLIRWKGAFGGTAISRSAGDEIRYQYIGPTGTEIDKVLYNYALRSGEGVRIQVYNIDQATSEDNNSDNTGSVITDTDYTITFSGGVTASFRIDLGVSATDSYNNDDWISITDIRCYWNYNSSHSAYGSENYYGDEIIEDLIWEADLNSVISTDVTGLASPGLALIPFTTLVDKPEDLNGIITKIAQYGDTSNQTWRFFLDTEEYSSDSLPFMRFFARDDTDYDFKVNFGDIANNFNMNQNPDRVRNWINVHYIDSDNRSHWLTPNDNAALTDSTSTAAYGVRVENVDASKGTSTTALEIGKRYLAFLKDPLWQGSFTLPAFVETKAGMMVPSSWVTARHRVQVNGWDPVGNAGYTIFFLGQSNYNDTTKTNIVTPDTSPPNIVEMIARQEELETVR